MGRILIVDDKPEMRGLLRDILEEFGHRVSEAADGLEALQQVESGDMELVVMDVMMPNMDGNEACRRIKSRPESSSLPVVLLTTPWMPQDEWLALELTGADAFVSKPFDTNSLLEKISALLTHGPEPDAKPGERSA